MLATHIDAENRYTKIRKATIKATQKMLIEELGITNLTLKSFDKGALVASKAWRNSILRRVNWNWIDGYAAFKFRHPKRFELAIWHKNSLISLTLGRPTYKGTAIRLDFIEANPNKAKDMKVVPIALFAMVAYAEALGAKELRIVNPINEEVRKYYESLNLIYAPKGDYLYRKL